MTDWQLLAGDALVLLGTLGTTLAVLAILRLPDSRAKIQASSASPVIGVSLMLAASFPGGDPTLIARSVLVGVVLVVGSGLGAHALMELARKSESPGRRGSEQSEPDPD